MKKIKEKVLKFFEISSELKRASAFALAFLLSFLSIVPGLKAESGTSSWISGYYYKSGYNWGQMPRLYIDGEDVFCLEQGIEFVNGNYTQGDVSSILTNEQKDRIELIHHFGYVLNGKGDRNRAFTQIAIWETVGNYTKIGSYNGGNDRRGDYENWLADVEGKMNRLMQVPSWNRSTISGKLGETITLDGEGKINNSEVLNSNGSKVFIESGQIKINIIDESKSGYIRFEKEIPSRHLSKGVSLLYRKSGSQKVGRIRLGIDPPKFAVNLEIQKNPTRARILKKGEAGEVVVGAKFEMCYSKEI